MRRAVIVDDGVVLGLHGARYLHVNVRTDALQADPDETSAGYGWKYVLVPLNDDLQELAQFINALTCITRAELSRQFERMHEPEQLREEQEWRAKFLAEKLAKP
jgi:hypothetical protein